MDTGTCSLSSPAPVRIGLLGASFHTQNLGVNALTVGAIRTVLQRYPKAKVFLLNYEKSPEVRRLQIDGREISIPLVNLRFSKRIYLPNNIALLLLLTSALRLLPSKMLRQRLLSANPWLFEIDRADLFASVSGGDSFSDIYGLLRLVYESLPQMLVLLWRKRLILLPQTLGPFRGTMARAIARYILRRAERIYSRDFRGADAVRTLLDKSQAAQKTAFCYDMGFVLEPVAPARLEVAGFPGLHSDGSPLVGVNVSGLLAMGGYTRKNMFGLRVDYRKLVASLIELLIIEKKARVLLLPHVYGDDPNSESDVPVCEEFFQQFRAKYEGRIGLLRGTYRENEIKHVIGQCDFFIGSRMHACIAAVSQGVPALAIAYSDKFIGVMETLETESLVADARHLSQVEILQRVISLYDQRQAVRKELERRMPHVRRQVLALFDDLTDLRCTPKLAAGEPIETSASRQTGVL